MKCGGKGGAAVKRAVAKAEKTSRKLEDAKKQVWPRLSELTAGLVREEMKRCSELSLKEIKKELRSNTVPQAIEKHEFAHALALQRVDEKGLSMGHISDLTNHELLYDAFPHYDDLLVGDRKDPGGFHCQAWAEGVGNYYVGTDISKIRISPTSMKPGQYHLNVGSRARWKHFESPTDKGYPGNKGGFDAAVIDTKQPGSKWVVSGQLHTVDYRRQGFPFPHKVNALANIFISRSDYQGFVDDKNEEFNDTFAPSRDQVRGHYKIADLPVLGTGRILFADLCQLSKDKANTLGKGFDVDTEFGIRDHTDGVSFATPTDGYYPIILHHDSEGKVNLITIKMMLTEEILDSGYYCYDAFSGRYPDCVNEAEIKIIFFDQDSGTKNEQLIKPSLTLNSVFGAYADQCCVSLRSLRFSYEGSTLFLSSVGKQSFSDLGMRDNATILVYNNSSASAQQPPQESKSESKKSKNKPVRKNNQKKKTKRAPQSIAVPITQEKLKQDHSIMLTKLFEEAEPILKVIRQRLNNLSLDCKSPKVKLPISRKKEALQSSAAVNRDTDEPAGKVGETSYALNVGLADNLYISSKRDFVQSSKVSEMLDLRGCNRSQAIDRLDAALVNWMDVAMKGEYPWVLPVVIVCGGANQLLSETVEDWIKENNNVANAPVSRHC